MYKTVILSNPENENRFPLTTLRKLFEIPKYCQAIIWMEIERYIR